MVTGQDVAEFLGRGDDAELVTLAGLHLPVVTAFVRAYVRGNGFVDGEANADLQAVIKTACSRLAVNPQQARRIQIDDFSQTFATLDGFTLPELAILNLYRRRVG
ncbi:hypothetical protein [Glutamicibacter arilaitensis]|uniref:hypothetical protein n=1 Tax=Glutamicibacter arilaitensis TaxID=256701 RepID=UPI003A9538BF